MKILKIFGIVVGIHVFALILIFANPGCSSTTKPVPSAADTVAATPAPQSAPMISVPPAGGEALTGTAVAPAPGMDAAAGGEDTSGVRFSPTRPNTPAASAVLRGPVENVTPATTYTVKSGDSLWSLQKKFHVPYKEIAEANNMRTNAPLHPGQKLIIPTPASKSAGRAGPVAAAPAGHTARAAAPSARPSSHEFKYKVKPGETLGGIAHKFGVPVRTLAVQNSISDPMKLRAGTELVIPGWQPAGGAAAESRPASRRPRAPSAAPAPAPAPSEPQPTPSATPEQTPPAQVPNLLAPSPSEPTPTQTSTVPVINVDDGSSTSTTSSNQ